MLVIENPFAGYPIGADFKWHKSHGYEGGTDYKLGPDQPITAATDGTVHKLSNSEIALNYGASKFINYREVKSLVGKFPREVKRGDLIGYTGNEWGGVVRWPHIDRTVRGVRLPFEPAVNTTATKPANTDKPVPLPEPELTSGDEDMFQYQKKGTGSRFYVHPSLPVKSISSGEWSSNLAVGIRSERDVDDSKAEKFRAQHNALVHELSPSVKSDVTTDIVERVLAGLSLSGDLAGDVSDAVYAKIKAGGVPLTTAGVGAVAKATATEFAARLTK